MASSDVDTCSADVTLDDELVAGIDEVADEIETADEDAGDAQAERMSASAEAAMGVRMAPRVLLMSCTSPPVDHRDIERHNTTYLYAIFELSSRKVPYFTIERPTSGGESREWFSPAREFAEKVRRGKPEHADQRGGDGQ